MRDSYLGRALGNAATATLKPFPSAQAVIGTYAIGLVAVFILRFVGSSGSEKAVDALVGVLVAIAATVVVVAAFFLVNLILAPSRLDKAAAQVVADANAAREAAAKALEERNEATRVAVKVQVIATEPFRAVDVEDATIEAWVAAQRNALGSPPLNEPSPYVSDLRTGAIASLALGGLMAERRTPDEFRAQVDAWLARVRAGARDELLRLGLEAKIAVLHVYATNTGHRHLSEVRVRLRFDVGLQAAWAGPPATRSRIPKPPRRWGVSALAQALAPVDISGLRAYAKIDREIYASGEDLLIEFEPLALPPKDVAHAGSVVLAIPGTLAGRPINGRWRVTAKEAEDDVSGAEAFHVEPEPLGPDALNALVEAQFEAQFADN